MKLSVYCIKDTKTSWLTPTVDRNDLSAKRNFSHAVRNPDSLFFTFPADFSLYRIAEFDNETGDLIGYDPVRLARGDEVLSNV